VCDLEVILIIVFFIVIAYGRWLLNSPKFKGARGERRVNAALKKHLSEEYHIITDLTLPSLGKTTQIDHVIISRFGVFVIETKNMQGWIFGDANRSQWTQTIYRHKTQFQNPLRQNFKHIKAIQNVLNINQNYIHNLVVFVGSAEPRTSMPANVIWDIFDLLDYILLHEDVFFDEDEVTAIYARLSDDEFTTNLENQRAHISNLEQAINLCPRCGSALEVRINKRSCSQFLGCIRFPSCKGTRPIQ
jgi:hypothetical protein